MIIKHKLALRNFEFWDSAKAIRDCLSNSEMDKLEELIERMYPRGIEPITLNDIFIFEQDLIAEFLGYKDFDNDIWNKRH